MRLRPSRNRRTSIRAAGVLAVLVATGCCAAERKGAMPVGRFEGDFDVVLRAADPSRRFVALVDLTERVDLKRLSRTLRETSASKSARRDAVIHALEGVASRQQTRLRPLLERLQARGALSVVHPVAIVNRLVVEATAAALLELGSSPEVAYVRPEWTSERSASRTIAPEDAAHETLGGTFRSWAIGAMKADRLWSQGLDGTGIVVAAIDTGALESHEQLRDRRMPGERGWFDPVEASTIASDRHGHGTGVLSQAVGGNPDGRLVGIAPGARWAAAAGNRENYYSRARMTLAADWALRVARPDVLINPWSHHEGACGDFDLAFIEAWKASGIFVVFPAGNDGPERATGESPAQLPGIFSVTALSESERLYPLASRGPSRCGSAAFPSVAAPGAGLPIASAGGPDAYMIGDGTSLSAGLLGGAAALLLQAAPETDPDRLERVLVESARDIEPYGRDDDTGAGAVDLEKALAKLRSQAKR